MRRLIRPFWLGLRDGWTDGQRFGCGLTWEDDDDKNNAYDRGVNVGQSLAAVVGR